MARSQGNGGPIPPCPFLLRKSKFTHAKVAKAGTGDEGIRDSGVKGVQSHLVRFLLSTGVFTHAKGGRGMLFIYL